MAVKKKKWLVTVEIGDCHKGIDAEVRQILKIAGVEFAGSRFTDKAYQCGFFGSVERKVSVETTLGIRKLPVTVKDCGDDDGKRGRIPEAKEPDGLKAKTPSKPKETPKPKPKPKPTEQKPVESDEEEDGEVLTPLSRYCPKGHVRWEERGKVVAVLCDVLGVSEETAERFASPVEKAFGLFRAERDRVFRHFCDASQYHYNVGFDEFKEAFVKKYGKDKWKRIEDFV